MSQVLMHQSVMSEMTVLSKITLGLRGMVYKMARVYNLPLIYSTPTHICIRILSCDPGKLLLTVLQFSVLQSSLCGLIPEKPRRLAEAIAALSTL